MSRGARKSSRRTGWSLATRADTMHEILSSAKLFQSQQRSHEPWPAGRRNFGARLEMSSTRPGSLARIGSARCRFVWRFIRLGVSYASNAVGRTQTGGRFQTGNTSSWSEVVG